MESWTLVWTELASLNEDSLRNVPDNLSGVYRLSFRSRVDNKTYVFYVGQAVDIKQRLLQHLSVNEENDCIRNNLKNEECYFRYTNITRQSVRDATERAVYKEYGPRCNYQEPQGREDITVNLT